MTILDQRKNLFILAPLALLAVLALAALPGRQEALLHGLINGLLLLLAYTFVGYPFFLRLLAPFFSVTVRRDETYQPTVTLLVAAYNEAAIIEKKIQNFLELDYLPERLQLLIVSDGSTDGTNEIVERCVSPRVRFIPLPANRGKINALNQAMDSVNSEIVLFSDANVMYQPDVVRKLVRHFSDPRVGGVSGKVVLHGDAISYRQAEDRYYSVEHAIQDFEGRTGCVIGADGAMYAIRRNLFTPPPPDTILDDFVVPMLIAIRGHWILADPSAVGLEENQTDIGGEFKRRVRIAAGGFQCLLRGEVIPPLSRGFLLFKFISHKVLRWCSGLLSLLLLILLIRATHPAPVPYYTTLLFLFLTGITAALAGALWPAARSLKPIMMAHYLSMILAASIVGFHRAITGGQKVTWKRS